MRGERQLLRLGGYLVGRACQRLPKGKREERYREWAAELPAILHDPQIGLASRRAVRMLYYVADTARGAPLMPAKAARSARAFTAVTKLLLVACLEPRARAIWRIARTPGDGLNYLQLAWSLLMAACQIATLVRPTERVVALFFISSNLTLAAQWFWDATKAPRDWVNYFFAASFLVFIPIWWLARRWARTRRA